MAPRPIIIIGAGIGGLTAAIALRKAGLEVEVYERAPSLGEVGAGLGLMSNAVRVLDSLGLGQTIRREAHPLGVCQICTAGGRVLKSLPMSGILPADAPPSFVVHRADLHRWLLAELPKETVQTGSHCLSVSDENGHVRASFANGRHAEGSALIGADGVNSLVRQHLWGPQAIRYSGQTCYRGIANFTPSQTGVLGEIQGCGQRASVIYLGSGRTYWWAARNAPAGEGDEPALRRPHLLTLYRDWPFDIPQAIGATEPSAILRNDLCDIRPLREWGRGRITLLGDAAHPMLPNLGQGACSAIEDAIVLARHLRRMPGDPTSALRAYERERLPRATLLVNRSWQFGVPCLWTNKLVVSLRDNLLALTPASLMVSGFRRYLGFDAGTIES